MHGRPSLFVAKRPLQQSFEGITTRFTHPLKNEATEPPPGRFFLVVVSRLRSAGNNNLCPSRCRKQTSLRKKKRCAQRSKGEGWTRSILYKTTKNTATLTPIQYNERISLKYRSFCPKTSKKYGSFEPAPPPQQNTKC